jgi:hypothetical protein
VSDLEGVVRRKHVLAAGYSPADATRLMRRAAQDRGWWCEAWTVLVCAARRVRPSSRGNTRTRGEDVKRAEHPSGVVLPDRHDG